MLKIVLGAILFGLSYSEPLWSTEFTEMELQEHELGSVQNFDEWAAVYEKEYTNTEEASMHYLQWLENVILIAQHNSKDVSYKFRLNQFSDLSAEDFKLYVHGKEGRCFRPSETIELAKLESSSSSSDSKDGADPTSVDWRTKGVVTPVKNQGQCVWILYIYIYICVNLYIQFIYICREVVGVLVQQVH